MTSHVVLIRFPESAKAYETFTKLKQLDGGPVGIHSAAVLTRNEAGELSVQDGAGDAGGATGTLTGGLVGSLVGILGGPIGVLFGWATGALIGSTADAGDAADSLTLVDEVSNAIPAGETAVVAHIDESANAAVDTLAREQGGDIQRWDAEQLFAELEAAAEVDAKEQKEARKQAREAKRAQRKEDLKEKFSRHTKKSGS